MVVVMMFLARARIQKPDNPHQVTLLSCPVVFFYIVVVVLLRCFDPLTVLELFVLLAEVWR